MAPKGGKKGKKAADNDIDLRHENTTPVSEARATPRTRESIPRLRPSSPLVAPPIVGSSPASLPPEFKKSLLGTKHQSSVERLQFLDSEYVQRKRKYAEIASKPLSDRQDKFRRLESSEQVFQGFLDLKEAGLVCAREKAAVLARSYSDGDLTVTANKYDMAQAEAQSQVNFALGEVSVLRSARNKIIGDLTDASILQDTLWTEQARDWAYIDLLISRYLPSAGASRSVRAMPTSDSQRERFRKALIQAYDPIHKGKKDVWCCVSGDYWPASSIAAAHIVEANVGEHVAETLFGPPPSLGHIWTPRNRILMLKEYEEAWDAARIAIVPGTDESGRDDGSLEVIVLDQTILDEDSLRGRPWGRQLDHWKLQFPNDFRPSRRYLYFKFVMGLLRRHRDEVPGSEQDRTRLQDAARRVWASPGSYLKASMLFTLSRQAGLMSSDEACAFWGTEKPPDASEELANEVAKTMAFQAEDGMMNGAVDDGEGGVESILREKAEKAGKNS